MSRSLMPPSFLPAGVLDKGGRDKDGLFREAERNPPAGTRLGMPFRGAATNQEATNLIQHKGNFLLLSHLLKQLKHRNLSMHLVMNFCPQK